MDNSFLKDINSKINEKVQQNKELFEKEQLKAKEFFNEFKQHSLIQYEDAKEHLQEHINHFNSFSENLKNNITKSPFDFTSVSQSLLDYNKKSFEIVSNATKKQAGRISDLTHKINDFYKNELNHYSKPVETKTEEVNQKPVAKKTSSKKPVTRKTVKKTTSE